MLDDETVAGGRAAHATPAGLKTIVIDSLTDDEEDWVDPATAATQGEATEASGITI